MGGNTRRTWSAPWERECKALFTCVFITRVPGALDTTAKAVAALVCTPHYRGEGPSTGRPGAAHAGSALCPLLELPLRPYGGAVVHSQTQRLRLCEERRRPQGHSAKRARLGGGPGAGAQPSYCDSRRQAASCAFPRGPLIRLTSPRAKVPWRAFPSYWTGSATQ